MKYLAILLLLIAGCYSGHFKAIDGTNLELGISDKADTAKLNILHYLNGSIVNIKDKVPIFYTYTSVSSNSYFGVVDTTQYRTATIITSPTNSVSNTKGN